MFDSKHLHIDRQDAIGDWLGKALQSAKRGGITIDVDKIPSLRISVANERIDVDLLQAKFFKNSADETGLFDKLKTATEFGRSLRDNGITLKFSRKGKETVTLGKEAKPTLSKILTKSDNIQVNSVKEFMNLKKDLKAD